MSTPHIRAKKGDFAKTVLLPGDPLRAKFIAENFLEQPRLVTDIRNMLGYTGTYQGKPVSVMGTGMGIPSIGIYSHELITEYGVENLIRVGSCGTYREDIELYDIILVQGASTNSNYASTFHLNGQVAALASWDLLYQAFEITKKMNIKVHVGNILSSDIFYHDNPNEWKNWKNMGLLGVEMESYGLYLNAQHLGANALTILTVSDSLVTHQETTAEERQNSFTHMMEIALNIA